MNFEWVVPGTGWSLFWSAIASLGSVFILSWKRYSRFWHSFVSVAVAFFVFHLALFIQARLVGRPVYPDYFTNPPSDLDAMTVMLWQLGMLGAAFLFGISAWGIAYYLRRERLFDDLKS